MCGTRCGAGGAGLSLAGAGEQAAMVPRLAACTGQGLGVQVTREEMGRAWWGEGGGPEGRIIFLFL